MKKTLLKLISSSLSLVLLCGALSSCADVPTVEPVTKNVIESEFFGEMEDEISYVLIYNPKIYEESGSPRSMNTGELSDYVEAITDRADGEVVLPEIIPSSVAQNSMGFALDSVDAGNRAGFGSENTYEPYKVGDVQTFSTVDNDRWSTAELTCIYTGEYCNIWTNDSNMTEDIGEKYADKFDEDIYEQMKKMFGDARFSENGRKVNFLFYPTLGASAGMCIVADVCGETNGEQSVLHINSRFAPVKSNFDAIVATLAHEFQHYILISAAYEANKLPGTWINEAMSGYVEEYLYPGIQKDSGAYDDLADSTRIRHGQSLYNFDTDTTATKFDIGVYSSVYLFAEYLAENAGKDVFSNFHTYWRNEAGRYTTDAEAIVESVSDKFYKKIDKSIDYDNEIYFDSDEEEWLSKLALDFYLSLLKYDKNDPKAFENIESQTLLYDEINPADIEGGGRVIAALKEGEFEAPEDADEGFIYVGLNEDFEIVTKYIYK